jgi:hypothetical protein
MRVMLRSYGRGERRSSVLARFRRWVCIAPGGSGFHAAIIPRVALRFTLGYFPWLPTGARTRGRWMELSRFGFPALVSQGWGTRFVLSDVSKSRHGRPFSCGLGLSVGQRWLPVLAGMRAAVARRGAADECGACLSRRRRIRGSCRCRRCGWELRFRRRLF